MRTFIRFNLHLFYSRDIRIGIHVFVNHFGGTTEAKHMSNCDGDKCVIKPKYNKCDDKIVV